VGVVDDGPGNARGHGTQLQHAVVVVRDDGGAFKPQRARAMHMAQAGTALPGIVPEWDSASLPCG
jgi:hypothetical protein